MEIAEAFGITWLIVWGGIHLGWVAWARGELVLAEARCRHSLALTRQHGFPLGSAWGLQGLGLIALSRGEIAQAETLWSESLVSFRAGGLPFDIAFALNCVGQARLAQGDTAGATAQFEESMQVAQPAKNSWNIANSLEGLGRVAWAQGLPSRAAQLFGNAEALRESMAVRLWPPYLAPYEQLCTEIRRALGDALFGALWAEGRASAFTGA